MKLQNTLKALQMKVNAGNVKETVGKEVENVENVKVESIQKENWRNCQPKLKNFQKKLNALQTKLKEIDWVLNT